MKKRLVNLVAVTLLLVSVVVAQETATINLVETAPLIDGDISEWANIAPIGISVARDGDEIVTYTSATEIEEVNGETIALWKAVWKDDAVYILVEVPDDNFFSMTEAGGASHEADKPEIYFDVNPTREDGLGASDGQGHYQIAIDVEGSAEDENVAYYFYGAGQDNADNYAVEYKIPFSTFEDVDGNPWTPEDRSTIGFDITVIDRDEEGTSDGGPTETTSKQRVCWSNPNSSWSNMDGSGEITFGLTIGVNDNKYSKTNVLTTNLVVSGTLEFAVDVVDVKITNTIGQVVSTSSDVSYLKKGLYIAIVKTTDGTTVANCFVKR